MDKSPVIHSMLRRCNNWDYSAPAIYQLTLVLADRRRELLGRLELQERGDVSPRTEHSGRGGLEDEGSVRARCPVRPECPVREDISSRNPVVISVVRDREMYAQCVENNQFWDGCELVALDNTVVNEHIGVKYNRFLNSFDYSKPAWLIFCHEDWQLKEDITPRLGNLDCSTLWGPIGARTRRRFWIYAQWQLQGLVEECRKDGSGLKNSGLPCEEGTEVDTFDCQCLIVHSSFIEKTGLRFDEKLSYDLYVEDFCIAANERFGVKSRILPLKCLHHSGGNLQPRYYEQEAYLSEKWAKGAYAATSSWLIGKSANWWWRFTVAIKKIILGQKGK